MKPIRIAVLPVAGFGTRMLPATKAVPKELLPVVDQPVLQYVYDEAVEAGIEHIVFVTGRQKNAIEDYFDESFELEHSLKVKGKTTYSERLENARPAAGSTSFVRQQAANGLGHAVWCARDIVRDEPFAVLLPDVLIKGEKGCLKQMVEAYQNVGGNILAVDEVPNEKVSNYGVIQPKDGADLDDQVIAMDGMVEKPAVGAAPSNMKITGRYILQPEIMTFLSDQEPGAGGEVQLTDAMVRLMGEQAFHAFRYEGQDYDCGSKLGYFEAILGYSVGDAEIGHDAERLLVEMSKTITIDKV